MSLRASALLSLTLCVWLTSPALHADEKSGEESRRTLTYKKLDDASSGEKYWIGVQLASIDEGLKSHLNLSDRLKVTEVFPDSPAAKAEFKTLDILLQFAGQEIKTAEDLVQAVNKQGNKEAEVVALRAGKEITLKVTPVERKVLGVRQPEIRAYVQDENGENRTFTLRSFGPGVFSQGAAIRIPYNSFPSGLSLSISKQDDQPAKIVAKKDGKTYETTEDKLGELPDEIRELVERSLRGGQVFAFSPDGKATFSYRIEADKLREAEKMAEAARKRAHDELLKAQNQAKHAINRIEILRQDESPLKGLREEIELLRKEVRELREATQPGASPEKKE